MNHKIDNLLSHTGDMALRRRAKWILEKIYFKNPKSILDIGCGDGFYLYLLYSLFPNVKIIGVDNDKNALKSASSNLKGGSVKLKYEDIYNLSFYNNSFDVVILSEVLEHLDDDFKGLQQVYRILKSKGLLLISVPNRNYPLLWDPINWIAERIFNTHIPKGFWAGIWNQHKRLYSPHELERLLKKGGFRGIKTEVLTHICLPFNHYLLNIFARMLAVRSASLEKNPLSKFSGGGRKKLFNPFWLLFQFDKLNDIFKSNVLGISVVASATKV